MFENRRKNLFIKVKNIFYTIPSLHCYTMNEKQITEQQNYIFFIFVDMNANEPSRAAGAKKKGRRTVNVVGL